MERLRRLLAAENGVVSVVALPEDTFGAGVETVVLRVAAGGRTPLRVPVYRAEAGRPTARTGTLHVNPEAREAPWPLTLDVASPGPVVSGDGPTLCEVTQVTRGINPYHHTTHTPEEIASRLHHADHAAGPDFAPELRGRDLAPFRVAWGGRRFVRYGPWLKEPRDPAVFTGPRLLVRKILGATLVAAYLEGPFYCDQSVYIARLLPGQPWPPLALLGCLGSRFLADLLRTRHQEHDRLFPQLKVAELRAAPLPAVPPDSPSVRALAELVAAHVAAGAPENARAPIDAAVAALYDNHAPRRT